MLAVATLRDGSRGAVATDWIGPGDCVLLVPHACLLTTNVALESRIGREMKSAGVDHANGHAYLAAFLLSERDENTRWHAYFSTVPQHAPRTPIFFRDDELAELTGSSLLPRALAQRAALTREWEQIRNAVTGLAHHSETAWRNARALVSSRVFGLQTGGHIVDALVPMADIPNHRRPPETSWSYDEARGAFEVRATRAFAPGEAVHTSYGAKCNSRLLLHYGFCLEDNECNEAVVQVLGTDFRLTVAPDTVAERALQAALEDDAGDVSDEQMAHFVARRIVDACDRALGAFPTSLSDDERLLAAGISSDTRRNCILLRLGEKRVLAAVRQRYA
jgi:histone-lysine N-methyltransferase SETD3